MNFKEIMELQADQYKELPPCKYCGGSMIVYCCDVQRLMWTAECYECDLTLGEYPTYEKACEATYGKA